MEIIRPQKFKSKLLEKRYVTETVLELVYETPNNFKFIPGHFINIGVTPPYRRAYSIVDIIDKKIYFQIDVREPGKGSDYFKVIEVGATSEMIGPGGRFFVQDNNKKKVFICTGVGLAPFIGMIRKLYNDNRVENIDLLCGMRFKKDDLALFYLKELIDKNFINYFQCISREDVSQSSNQIITKLGRVTSVLPSLTYNFLEAEFYICGSTEMINDTKAVLLNLNATNIYTESFG